MKDRSMNERRADWAEEAVEAFAMASRMEGEDRETQVHDLLADLRHLCDRWGLKFDKLNDKAEFHYEAEILEDGPRCRRARRR
jgi:hypothetical protein